MGHTHASEADATKQGTVLKAHNSLSKWLLYWIVATMLELRLFTITRQISSSNTRPKVRTVQVRALEQADSVAE